MMHYDSLLNKKLLNIQPSGIRRFFDLAEQMDEVISLGVGEPDFKTPWTVRQEAIHKLDEGKTRYTEVLALTKPRERAELAFSEYELDIHVFAADPADYLDSDQDVQLDAYGPNDPFSDTDLPVRL